MKKRFFAMLFAAVLILSSIGCQPKTKEKLEVIPVDLSFVQEDFTLEELKDLNGGNVEVIYSGGSGPGIPKRIKEIKGVFSTRKILTKEDAVYALMNVRSLMQIKDASFACTKIDDSGKYRKFRLQQIYKGIAVFSSGFSVYATKNEGKPVSVTGYYKQGLNLDVEPKISEEEARKVVKLEWGTKITESRLVVYGAYASSEPESRLAWEFIVLGKPEYSKNVYVDAVTGNVLAEYPHVDFVK